MKGVISTKALWPSDSDGEQAKGAALTMVLTFAVPALLVVGLMFLLITFQGNIETGISNLALLLPLGYGFAAGMVASVNPCGVLMLSSYAFYQVRSEERPSSASRRALRAIWVSAVITLIFVVIFGAVGGTVSAGGQWLTSVFPLAGLAIGIGMILLGGFLIATRQTLSIEPGKNLKIDPGHGVGNSLLFGAVYAIASLSCTLPIFLVVVSSSLTGQGFWGSFGPFMSYALGMGTVILIVTLGAALFQRAMARWIRSLMPHIHRLSALFLIGAGIYLVYYWVFLAQLR
jgi:cytochrome c biogenesis protein CcdA